MLFTQLSSRHNTVEQPTFFNSGLHTGTKCGRHSSDNHIDTLITMAIIKSKCTKKNIFDLSTFSANNKGVTTMLNVQSSYTVETNYAISLGYFACICDM